MAGRGDSGAKVRFGDLLVTASLWFAGQTKLVLFFTVVIAPSVGTLLVTLGQSNQTAGDRWRLYSGIALIAFGGFVQIAKQFASGAVVNAEEFQRARFRIATKDVIQPIAAVIAEMPSMNENDRHFQLRAVAEKVSAALILLLNDVYRLRAIVYTINKDGGLQCLSYNGRADDPSPFLLGTDRGDAALRLVHKGGLPKLVADVENTEDPGMADFHGTKVGYRTFITGGIGTKKGERYGMVSIDAPDPGVLVDTDRYVVGMCADLMAIAFAVAGTAPHGAKAGA